MRAACSDGTSIRLKFQIEAGKFCHMPVLEGGQLAGIVSIGDVVKSHVEEIEREAAALRDYIRQ